MKGQHVKGPLMKGPHVKGPLMKGQHVNENGAGMVEASIAGVAFLSIFFLVFQCALLARANLGADYGATSGARAGAIAANHPSADYDILTAVGKAAVAGSKADVTRVIVFKAANPGSGVPAECLAGPVAGKCNVYAASDLDRSVTDFGPGDWAGDDSWSSLSRLTSRQGGTDFLGVFVEIETRAMSPMPERVTGTYIAQLEATRD